MLRRATNQPIKLLLTSYEHHELGSTQPHSSVSVSTLRPASLDTAGAFGHSSFHSGHSALVTFAMVVHIIHTGGSLSLWKREHGKALEVECCTKTADRAEDRRGLRK